MLIIIINGHITRLLVCCYAMVTQGWHGRRSDALSTNDVSYNEKLSCETTNKTFVLSDVTRHAGESTPAFRSRCSFIFITSPLAAIQKRSSSPFHARLPSYNIFHRAGAYNSHPTSLHRSFFPYLPFGFTVCNQVPLADENGPYSCFVSSTSRYGL